MKIDDLALIKRIFEGALMAADKPLQRRDLTALFDALEQPEDGLIDLALKDLVADCEDKGFELRRVASGYRYQVKQDLSRWVNKLWHERAPRYSHALLKRCHSCLSSTHHRRKLNRSEAAVSSQIIKPWFSGTVNGVIEMSPGLLFTPPLNNSRILSKSLDQLPPRPSCAI